MKTALILLATAVWIAACATRADGPPEIVMDRSACSQCGMLISEPVYAAALRTPDGRGRVFDDIGCLLRAVREDSIENAKFWFHDAGDGHWVDGTVAVFVRSHDLRTPMAGGVIAYSDAGAAERAASKSGGSLVRSVGALLAEKGGQQ